MSATDESRKSRKVSPYNAGENTDENRGSRKRVRIMSKRIRTKAGKVGSESVQCRSEYGRKPRKYKVSPYNAEVNTDESRKNTKQVCIRPEQL